MTVRLGRAASPARIFFARLRPGSPLSFPVLARPDSSRRGAGLSLDSGERRGDALEGASLSPDAEDQLRDGSSDHEDRRDAEPYQQARLGARTDELTEDRT